MNKHLHIFSSAHLHIVLFAYLLICTSLSSCTKTPDDPPPVETPQPCTYCLPPITTTGKGTFGCKVNGVIWLPKSGWMRPGTRMYYYDDGLTIVGYNEDRFEYVNLSLTPITDTGYFDFSKQPFLSSRVNFPPPPIGNEYESNPASIGNLHILCFDMTKGIVSGTFAFDAYNEDGDTAHITEGRFDLGF